MVERSRRIVASLLIPPRGRHTRVRRGLRLRPIQAILALLILAGGLATVFVSATGANAGGHGQGSYGSYGYGHRHPPVITTSSSVTSPGGSLAVYCKNFAPREKIALTLYSDVVDLGRTTSNNDGSCFTYVTIPSNTRAGEHTIVANGATGDSASTQITVVIPHHRGGRHF